ncbi:MAG: VWA domain-containing protein [Armatimonadota bacterium]
MITFTKPAYLLLLPLLGYFTWRLTRGSLADLSKFRSRMALGLRLIIIALLICALAGARVVKNASQESVVFVLDVSDSIPKAKQDAALAFVNNALKHKKNEQKIGLIAFGADASVELAPSDAIPPGMIPGGINRFDKIYSVPNPSNTDISQALGLALATFPEQSAKKIVLLSDGNETIGKAIEQAALIGANGVSIDTVPIASQLPREALLDKMISPGSVKVGEPFDLKIIAVSKQPTLATIRLLRNNTPVGIKTVELVGSPPGKIPGGTSKNVLTFRQSIPKPGNYEYRAILDCPNDTRPENNTALSYTIVRGKPKVLYIEGQLGQASYLASALRSSDIDVDTRDPSGVPTSLAQMQGYDIVVFSDLPAWKLSPDQMRMIQSGVKDLGIGFTMIGGENSFGAGGYFDTPIEQALPVDMSIRKTKILPSLSVVIVMDKSGSMGAIEGGREKIQLANDAAAAVVKLLQPIDKVGIIVCHSYPVAAVPLKSAVNKGPIYGEISTIRAEGGGIAVYPSMVMAHNMIKNSGTRQKHIILLADGSDCDDQEGVIPLVQQMQKQKITVTAVAIGDGPHVPFLKGVAYYGKGGYYLAQRAADLKAIFTKDVMTISKSLVIEEPFTPRADPSSPELGGIDLASMPPLLGYVATSAKPAARVAIASQKNDPIFVTWQYGLGRSAAFTSDCKARWAARWLTWPNYNKFWAQAVRSTMRKSASKDFQSSVEIDSGVGRVNIDAVDEKGNFINLLKFAGSVVGPDMTSHALNIEQTGPGRYEASFDAREVGTYVVNVARRDSTPPGKIPGGIGDRIQDSTAPDVSVVSIPYPAEYKQISSNEALLRQLASETSGRFDPKANNIFSSHFRKFKTYTDLWRLLIILAAVLFPLDVAVRRVALSSELAAEIRERVVNRIRRRRALKRVHGAERVESVGSLLQSKKQRKESDEDVAINAPAPLEPKQQTPFTPSVQDQHIASNPPGKIPGGIGDMRHRGKDSPDNQNDQDQQQSYVRGKNTPDDHGSAKPQEPRKDDNTADTTSRLLAAKRRAKDKRE